MLGKRKTFPHTPKEGKRRMKQFFRGIRTFHILQTLKKTRG